MSRNEITVVPVIFAPAPLTRLDRSLFAGSAALRPSPADPVLRGLSRAADHGRLWMGCAAACAAIGGRPRRGAVRGMLALAGASALANGVLKPLLPRRRPPARQDGPLRRSLPTPRSSSFPSGHSASAAAFTTGMALESPVTGALLAPVAAAVAYSRVHTGVHWPADVVTGVAVGAAVALATRRWWAVRPDEPARLGPPGPAPALPQGRDLLVLVNPGAGRDDDAGVIAAALPQARVVTLDPDEEFTAQLDRFVAEHTPAALGVHGGDGTVRAAASAAVAHGLPLAVFPGGTLNHFARDAGLLDLEQTVRAVERGQALRVDLGRVWVDGTGPDGPDRSGPDGADRGGHVFVNTASVGGYPDSVRLRERWEPRIGKWPAAAAALAAVLATASPLRVSLDGVPTAVWLLFVGSGRYAPDDRVPMSRPRIDTGTLDVRYLRADLHWSRTRLLAAAVTGSLAGSPIHVRREAPALSVRVRSGRVALATDGEVLAEGALFEFRSVPGELTLYRPLDQEP
ncbi:MULTISPECIES: phosphatase PAP2 family protein [Rhodococcus]|uniref:phosphatase PAP2 family protein n=1 Tax=Rhodococcus TaxID=1827 RepID=UPI001EF160BD|nr:MULTISPECIES: phosphatase PAP2 family protein [Rhodococcus]